MHVGITRAVGPQHSPSSGAATGKWYVDRMPVRHPPGLLLLLLATTLSCSDYSLNEQKPPQPEADTGDPAPTTPTDTGLSDTDVKPGDSGTPDDQTCEDEARPVDQAVDVDDACVAQPTLGSFTPTVEWQWSVDEVHGGFSQVMSTPAVGSLDDDNGDGVIDGDDTPEIVFTSYGRWGYTGAGIVTAMSGDGSGVLWSVYAPGGEETFGCSGVAIGDLDGDGSPEVCVSGVRSAVVCLSGQDGSLKWAAGTEVSTYGAPAIADLEGDGLAEVIQGRQVFRHDGTTAWLGTGGRGGGFGFSFAADWDMDGQQEVVAGNTVYDTDGSTLWTHALGDGMPAVGDFTADGLPDLVQVTERQVAVVANDGTTLWQAPITTGRGGAPTVADFDGDGEPEVGVAGGALYTVFDTDGTVLWQSPTQDQSSNVTGSSVFDFEGDGDAEVVYADEQNLWVFEGRTGAVLLQVSDHTSGTAFEYPVIADVDGDDSAEIVLASNRLISTTGWYGVTVIGDADSSWARARPVWNQFAYSITNIDSDGSVPDSPIPNWLSWNDFRTAGTELGPSGWRPDLRAGIPETCLDDCDIGQVQVWIPIENTGLLDVQEPVTLAFARDAVGGTEVLRTTATSAESGTARYLGPIVLDRETWGEGSLVAVVDPDDAVDECATDNNSVDLGTWPCTEP